jgi:hypothetical protein
MRRIEHDQRPDAVGGCPDLAKWAGEQHLAPADDHQPWSRAADRLNSTFRIDLELVCRRQRHRTEAEHARNCLALVAHVGAAVH